MGSLRRSITRRLSSFTKNKTSTNSMSASGDTASNSNSNLVSSLDAEDNATVTSTGDMNLLNKELPKIPSENQSPEADVCERDYPLFNMDRLDIPQEHRAWFKDVNVAVRTFMNGLDASHNYQHIRRVVANAHHILEKEKKHHHWARDIDPMIVWVGCMTHDVGDAKYRAIGEDRDQNTIIDEFLEGLGCPLPIRRQASYLAARVSFTAEMKDKHGVKGFAEEYPAFRIMQDADRLDGLGTVGVSRLFVYGGVDEIRRQGLIDSGTKLIEERFVHYPELMKTKTGRAIAEERYAWMTDEFVKRWRKETDTSDI